MHQGIGVNWLCIFVTCKTEVICRKANAVTQTNCSPLWVTSAQRRLFFIHWSERLQAAPSQFFIAPLQNIHHPLRVAKNSNSSHSTEILLLREHLQLIFSHQQCNRTYEENCIFHDKVQKYQAKYEVCHCRYGLSVMNAAKTALQWRDGGKNCKIYFFVLSLSWTS